MAYVAARKLDQELIIGNARIKVIEITRGLVRLAVIAPDSTVIRRAEQPVKLSDIRQESLSFVPGSCVLEVAETGSQRVA